MAYEFDNVISASIKFTEKNNELTLNGINGETNNANTIVNGLTLLLDIGNIASRYDPEDLVRTVKQNVNSTD